MQIRDQALTGAVVLMAAGGLFAIASCISVPTPADSELETGASAHGTNRPGDGDDNGTDNENGKGNGTGNGNTQENGNIGLFYDAANPRMAFGAGDVQQALEARGHTVDVKPLAELSTAYPGTTVTIGLLSDSAIAKALSAAGADGVSGLKNEGFALRTTTQGKQAYWVIGGDDAGAMYGALELAKKLHVYDIKGEWNFKQNAFIRNRGIKLNLSLDDRCPTFSNKGKQEHFNVMIRATWDIKFWEEYFDEMARARLNVMSFWTLHPFTVMMQVPGYEDVVIEDVYDHKGLVKKMTIEEKNAHWKAVHKYAGERGVKILWMTWNIFMYGAEGKHGITEEYNNKNTRTYLRKTMTYFLKEFPNVAGFIVHAGEHFDTDDDKAKADYLWETYGLGINDFQQQFDRDKKRDFVFVYRLHEGAVSTIESYFKNLAYPYEFSLKYSLAHMFNYPAPKIYLDLKGEKVLEELKKYKKRMWVNARNDDMYYLSFGDYNYARSYVLNFPHEPGDQDRERYIGGFYMGSDGNSRTRTWYTKDPWYHNRLEIKKHWYQFYAFGHAGYDPHRSVEDFKDIIRMRYPDVDADVLFDAWAAASRGIPMTNTMVTQERSWRWDHMWFPEVGAQKEEWGTIKAFQEQDPHDGAHIPITLPADYDFAPKGVCSFSDYESGDCGSTEDPVSWGMRMKEYARIGLSAPESSSNKELNNILGDIRAMSYQQWYYSGHIRAAAHDLKGDKDKAIEAAAEAYNAWTKFAPLMDDRYEEREHLRIKMMGSYQSKLKYVLDDYESVGGKGKPAPMNITAKRLAP